MDKIAQATVGLDEMTSSVVHINDLSTQIATAAEEQSAVAEEINRNMVAVRQVVDELVESGVGADRCPTCHQCPPDGPGQSI